MPGPGPLDLLPRIARRLTLARRLAPALLLLGAACHSTRITPDALREPAGRADERAAALARWEEAVALANDFLASSWRRTLPAGRFDLKADGMRFVMADGRTLPIAVASTTWGDLVVATGFRAQESEWGFCVGAIDPSGDASEASEASDSGDAGGASEAVDPLLDNTFFRYRDGDWHDAASLAEVTLHETTHDVYRVGTVGPWNTFVYYVVAIFTFSASTHTAEDRPRATSEEFAWFCLAREAEPDALRYLEVVRDEHLATKPPHCEHGPFH